MRSASVSRKTNETDISLRLTLDTAGAFTGGSGIGFFDHMLTLLAVHGSMAIDLCCAGDLVVDGHHSVEDTGICLGAALKEALCDKRGIVRYSDCALPMDEALARVALDISGRPYLLLSIAPELSPMAGDFDTQLLEEFLRAFVTHAGITLHVEVPYGRNTHHIIEAVFKALAAAIRRAVSKDPAKDAVPSSKGVL